MRKQLGFKGVIISDDLSMHGASFMGDHVSRAKAAIAAGCELILACNDSAAAISILDNLAIPNCIDSKAITQLAYHKNKIQLPLKNNPIWLDCTRQLQEFTDRVE